MRCQHKESATACGLAMTCGYFGRKRAHCQQTLDDVLLFEKNTVIASERSEPGNLPTMTVAALVKPLSAKLSKTCIALRPIQVTLLKNKSVTFSLSPFHFRTEQYDTSNLEMLRQCLDALGRNA